MLVRKNERTDVVSISGIVLLHELFQNGAALLDILDTDSRVGKPDILLVFLGQRGAKVLPRAEGNSRLVQNCLTEILHRGETHLLNGLSHVYKEVEGCWRHMAMEARHLCVCVCVCVCVWNETENKSSFFLVGSVDFTKQHPFTDSPRL